MTENKKLLNDIIQRNYIKYFQAGNQKQLSLVVSNGVICCPNCAVDATYSDEDMALGNLDFDNNLKICLDWYVNNKCICDINIIGNDCGKALEVICGRGDVLPKEIHVCISWKEVDQLVDYVDKFAAKGIKISFIIYADSAIEISEKAIPHIEKVITYITPDNVRQWPARYTWWLTDAPAELFDKLVIYETNKGWTAQDIEEYQKFYNYYLYLNAKLLHKDDMFDFIIAHELKSNGWTENNDYIPCNLQKQLCIYVPNNRLILCPGMLDELMAIGTLNSEGEFDETNVALNVIKDHIKVGALPRCETCSCVGTCRTGCWVESFKDHANILATCPEYCTIQKSKMTLLLKYLIDNNLYGQIETCENISPYYREYLRFQISKIAKENNKDA